MASKSYETGFKRYYGDRLANVSNETTEEEIARIYDNWANEYDKVTKPHYIITPLTNEVKNP